MTAPNHSNGLRCEPRLVFFDVGGRRDLAQRAAAAAPGVRFTARRAWTRDPGEPRRSLFGGREPPVGLWLWRGTQEQLTEQATAVLLRFVHPLVARGLPYCLGFPFGAEVFAPRRLGFGEAAALDLEDIGRLLGVGRPTGAVSITRAPTAACAPRAEPSGVQGVVPSVVPSLVPSAVPNLVPNLVPRLATTLPPAALAQISAAHPDTGQPPLDPAQRAAVEHARGPARVLAPAGSGKTKTLISRVLQLVERGTDPSGILMLAFNRKAAEQLEERLAAHGIPTTRRLGSSGTPSGRRTPSDAARRRPHSAAAHRRPLRHLQRLRLPLPARGARGPLLARPDRRRAARPHAPGHGDGRRLPRGSQARPRQRPRRRLHGRAHARARRARVTRGRSRSAWSRPASSPS